MKKTLLLATSVLLCGLSLPVKAQEDNAKRIKEIEQEIKLLQEELAKLKGEIPEDEFTAIGETFETNGLILTLDKAYLTDERDKFNDKKYDHVLVLEYTLENQTDDEIYSGSELELYVDGTKAETYYLPNHKSDSISKGRKAQVIVAFGFNGSTENMELEFNHWSSFDSEPVIIPLETTKEEKPAV